MELHELRALHAVATNGTFRAAAETLQCSPGSITKYINNLEHDIGAALVIRSTSGRNELSLAGEAFVDATRTLLYTLDRARDTARIAAATGARRVRFGHNGITGLQLLTRVLPAVVGGEPPIQVSLLEAPNSQLLAQLATSELDLAAVRPPIDGDHLSHEPLGTEDLVAVVASEHPLAKQRDLSIADLVHEPFVIPPRAQTPRVHDLILELCQEHGRFQPILVQEASSIPSILALVSCGAGVSLLPRKWDAFYRSAGTKSVRITDNIPGLPIHLAWRKGDQTPAVTEIRARMLSTVRPRS